MNLIFPFSCNICLQRRNRDGRNIDGAADKPNFCHDSDANAVAFRRYMLNLQHPCRQIWTNIVPNAFATNGFSGHAVCLTWIVCVLGGILALAPAGAIHAIMHQHIHCGAAWFMEVWPIVSY